MLEAGMAAPEFILPDADMDSFELKAELQRSHIVLYFYPRANTPGCTMQAQDFCDHEDDYLKHSTIIVGVSPDDSMKNAEFRDRHGLSLRLLSDEDGEVCRQYDVLRSRECDGVIKESVSRSTFLIDKKGMIRHVWRDVSLKGHAADVLQRIQTLDIENAD